MFDLFNLFLDAVRTLTTVVAAIIFISSLDDFLIDLVAIARHLYRRVVVFGLKGKMPLHENDLRLVPEKPIAILLPAWQEADVIGRMLDNTCRSYDYTDYTIFVGVYGNDPDTLACVEQAARKYERIRIAIVPHDGPTNKADCMNSIYSNIQKVETEENESYQIFIVHDAEDVVHPLELKLLNFLIPRKDMVQLPVIALERPWNDFTGGHYMDEFAENHAKDLLVREWLMETVPSAGVGCGLSRRAVMALAAMRGGMPFNAASLTEDYDLALQLKYLGFTQIFSRFVINRAQGSDIVATREFFPKQLDAACRQKSRWLLGIVFQSMAENGWRGPWRLKYALLRDRKGIVTALTAIAAYFIAAIWSGFVIAAILSNGGVSIPVLAPHGSVTWWLLIINAFLLLGRSLHRAYFTSQIYGWRQGLVSIPRQVWANIINFLAAVRALRLFIGHKISHRPLAWDKTRHDFPSEEELTRRRLGQQA